MKQALSYFKAYHSGYLKPIEYLWVLLYIGLVIFLNYFFSIENRFIDNIQPPIKRVPAFLGLNLIGYFGVLFLLKLFRGKELTLPKSALGYSFLGLLILSIDRSIFPYLLKPILDGLASEDYFFGYKVLYNSYGWVTIFCSLLLLKLLLDKKSENGFYGLQLKRIDFSLYGYLLLAIVPLTTIGALMNGLGTFYPVYQRSWGAYFAALHQIPEWVSVVIFEFFYLTDFLNTELLFRGFLVIGAAKYLGKDAILPMAAAYAVLHFGKPVAETISSVFGGYLLGVLAYYSKNIWGGVVIHTALAGGMEFFAYLL